MTSEIEKVLDALRLPFHPSWVQWKPEKIHGERALAVAYADLRPYMNRLDEVCADSWSVVYEPWGENRIICRLTIMGVTRSSTGEHSNGTLAETEAFRRAAAMFGIGRYLYTFPAGWVDYDPVANKFTDRAKARLNGLVVQHHRRATDGKTIPSEETALAEEEE